MDPNRTRHPALRLRTSWPAPHEVLVAVRGDLDTATAPYLAALLDDRLWAHPRRVEVDLSEVDFLGVAGLRVLTRAAFQAGQTGTDLRITTGTNPAVRRALSVTGADRGLTVSSGGRCPEPAPA